MIAKEIETELRLLTAGDNSVAALAGNRLLWFCGFGRGNTWFDAVELPKGLLATDVASLAPSNLGCALVTATGELHVWVRMGNSARWEKRGGLKDAVQ